MMDSELKSKINQLWGKFWSGGISNPKSVITPTLFIKNTKFNKYVGVI